MLAHRIASGALWLVGARLATRFLDLVSMMVVARLLVPADFGLFALAASAYLVLNAVTDMSLSSAIVQMREPPPSVYDTAFTLSILRGALLALLLAAFAYPFAAFYGDERLASILLVLAGAPILRSLVSPRMAHLQRQLNFRPQFQLEAAGKVAAFMASVAIAWTTRSYWALVAGMVAAPAISTTLSYRLAPYRPRLGLADWRPIFAFSGWLTLSNTVNTLNWQADRFFIGGRLGTAALGQYAVGSELASLPTNAPIQPIMQALYAGFAKLAGQRDRLADAYLLSQSAVLGVALPIAVFIAVFAYPIIDLAIGPGWENAAFIVQVLAPVMAVQMVTGPAQSIAMVSGRTRSLFWRDASMLAVRIPLIFVGMAVAGLTGIVWARVFTGLLIILINLSLVKSVLELSIVRQLTFSWRIYVSALVFTFYTVGLRNQLGVDDGSPVEALARMIGIGLSGGVVYASVDALLWLIRRPSNSIESKLSRLFPRRPLVSR